MLGVRHVAIGCVVPRLIILAGCEGEPGLDWARSRSGERAGATGGAGGIARAEAIPIPAVGLQADDLDVNRVGQLRQGGSRAGGDNPSEAFVSGHFPGHGNWLRGESTARLKRTRREFGPEHHPIGRRVTRGHAQAEGVARKSGRWSAAAGLSGHGQGCRHARGRGEKRAAGEARTSHQGLQVVSLHELFSALGAHVRSQLSRRCGRASPTRAEPASAPRR